MTAIHITGQMPENWPAALAELRKDLGFELSDTGMEIACSKGDSLSVESDGQSVRLTWAEPVQFYRALSLIPQPLIPCAIQEHPRFETVGVMFDCSRNAVLKPDAVRFFLRKMALMGLNLGMLYTEDTYEIPEQPFFGYKRGRYTFDELKALDDYAAMLGIELCPCIQTLGHLKRALHWPAMHHLRENESVLLADSEETYTFIDQMIRAASAPFRSRRIHIGMDEAYGVGVNEHLRRFGYEDPHAIMGRHLSRVLEITDKYGLQAMMWSDMYFHLDGCDYHSGGMPSEKAKAAVDPRISLVYWDYYHAKEEEYASALRKHAQLSAPTIFAGGIWTWSGIAPAYPMAIQNSVAGLTACMKADIPFAFATAWGDNGAEINLITALPGMQLYGEMAYTGRYDETELAERFRRCCGSDIQAFWDISQLNIVPGMRSRTNEPANACKFLLYQDPLVELFEADTAGFQMSAHFLSLVPLYERYAQENADHALLFEFYAALAQALALKCAWHESAAEAVRRGDRAQASKLADGIPAAIEAIDHLRRVWRKLWESTNKPNGFEVIEVRLGGVAARLSTAQEKMRAFAGGAVDDIPELTEPSLICKRHADGTMDFTNVMEEIATPGCIDW